MDIADINHLEKEIASATKAFAWSNYSGEDLEIQREKVVQATNKLPLSKLDYWERSLRYYYHNAIDFSDKSKWKLWKKETPPLTFFDLIHWDGHKREKAILELNKPLPNALFLLFYIRRLNDWVPQVREAAKRQFPSILGKSKPEDIVDALSNVFVNWHSWKRIDNEGKNLLLDLLRNESINTLVKNKLITSSSGPMCLLLSQIGRSSYMDKHLSELSQEAIQPHVRAKAYRCLFEQKVTWIEGHQFRWTDKRYCIGKVFPVVGSRKINVPYSLTKVINSSAYDTSSIVRRVSAEFLIREIDELESEAIKLAIHFSKDSSKAVSERGEFAFKKLNSETKFKLDTP